MLFLLSVDEEAHAASAGHWRKLLQRQNRRLARLVCVRDKRRFLHNSERQVYKCANEKTWQDEGVFDSHIRMNVLPWAWLSM